MAVSWVTAPPTAPTAAASAVSSLIASRIEYMQANPRTLTMGLDLDGDGGIDQTMQGPLGIDVDNDGIIDVVITPEQLRAFLIEQGLPPDKIPAGMNIKPLSPKGATPTAVRTRAVSVAEPYIAAPVVTRLAPALPQPMGPAIQPASARSAARVYEIGRTSYSTARAIMPVVQPYVPPGLPMTHRPPQALGGQLAVQAPAVPHPHGKHYQKVHLPVRVTINKISAARFDGTFPYHNPSPEVGCGWVGHVLPATSINLWLSDD